MKLQVNDSGAWKNVAQFDINDQAVVEKSACAIGHANALAGGRITFRLVDAKDQVVAYWNDAERWHRRLAASKVVA